MRIDREIVLYRTLDLYLDVRSKSLSDPDVGNACQVSRQAGKREFYVLQKICTGRDGYRAGRRNIDIIGEQRPLLRVCSKSRHT